MGQLIDARNLGGPCSPGVEPPADFGMTASGLLIGYDALECQQILAGVTKTSGHPTRGPSRRRIPEKNASEQRILEQTQDFLTSSLEATYLRKP